MRTKKHNFHVTETRRVFIDEHFFITCNGQQLRLLKTTKIQHINIMDSSFLDEGGIMEEPTLPIELKPTIFRPHAYRILSKKYGLNVQPKALMKLANFVGRRFGTKWNRDPKTSAFLDAVAKIWKEQGRGIFVDEEGISQVIKEIVANEQRMKKRLMERRLAQENNKGYEMDLEDSLNLDTTTFDSSMIVSSQVEPSSEILMDQQEFIDWKQLLKVTELNHFTKFSYDKRRKQFDFDKSLKPLKMIQLPEADAATKFYNGRLDILRDRIYRNNIFSKMKYDKTTETKSANQMRQPKHITMVKNLLGRNEQRFVLFGLVTLNSYGIWQLQDDSDSIELVLKQCIFPDDSYVVPGNFLIVDGFYSSAGKFHVLSVAHPPAEDRDTTLEAFGNIDFNWDYSKNGKIDLTMKKLTQREIHQHPEHKFIVLGGNLYLDDLETMNKLKKVLTDIETELVKRAEVGEEKSSIYEEPIAIIFNGPFSSKAATMTEGTSINQITTTGSYKAGFDNLAHLLESYKNICESCKLIFVPGDEDPWLSMVTRNANSIWPKMRIPEVFGLRLSKVAKNVVWSSNPTRINYLSHDIAIMRNDVSDSMKRNDFSYLCELDEEEIAKALISHRREEQKEDMSSQLSFLKQDDLEINKLTLKETTHLSKFNKLVKTLMDQGIMSPFTFNIRQLIPNYWPLMSLTPLPHCLIICDTTIPSMSTLYRGCHVANIGKFLDSKGRGQFLEYYPSSQACKVRTIY